MIIGHQCILEFFKKSIERNRVAHAYLFTGPDNIGKKTVAEEFVKMLDCRHGSPDVLIIKPAVVEKKESDGWRKKEKEITIKQARQICRQLSLSPYENPYKIVLIEQPERMRKEAVNALLKTLEEPRGKSILILISANPLLILPTVVSRCQIVRFYPVSNSEIEKALRAFGQSTDNKEDKDYEKIIRFSCGRPGLAVQYLKNPQILKARDKILKDLSKLIQADLNERYHYAEQLAKDNLEARRVLNYWLFWFRDLLLEKCGGRPAKNQNYGYSFIRLSNIIRSIRKTDELLSNPSINHRLVIESLMLEL